MADPVTGNIQLFVPPRGSNPGTWDAPLNGNASVIDACFGGVQSISLSNANVTLSVSQAQNAMILLTGALTANVDVIFPAIFKSYFIDNQTTGNFVVRIAPPSATQVVAVPQGQISQVMVLGTVARFLNLGKLGEYWDYAGATVPNWITACSIPPYLNCDGSTFSAITYPYLNTILGGNTLPDLRGGMRATLNQGTSRITTAGSGIDGDTRFSTGGGQNIALAQANLPNVNFTVMIPAGQGAHAHQYTSQRPDSFQAGPYSGDLHALTGNTSSATLPQMSGTAASGGSGTPVNKMPPTTISGITMIRAA